VTRDPAMIVAAKPRRDPVDPITLYGYISMELVQQPLVDAWKVTGDRSLVGNERQLWIDLAGSGRGGANDRILVVRAPPGDRPLSTKKRTIWRHRLANISRSNSRGRDGAFHYSDRN